VTFDILNTKLGQKLKDVGVIYYRVCPDEERYKDVEMGYANQNVGIYNSWQKSFMTKNKAEAENKAKSFDYTFK